MPGNTLNAMISCIGLRTMLYNGAHKLDVYEQWHVVMLVGGHLSQDHGRCHHRLLDTG